MADEKPKMVTVEALKLHTNAGESYDVGDTYEVDEAAVDNLVFQGMAVRADRVAVAKQAAKAAEKAAEAAATPARTSTRKPAAAKAKRGRRT